jgi:iron(III) transport system ATP-binding protein
VTNLVAKDIHKSFGSQTVLTGLELTVPEGALAAIVGPSGSGKTTFLRIAAGFERADRGTLAFGDLAVDGERFVPPEARGIGYVAQEGALFPHLNVRRNIAFGLRRDQRAARVDELLQLVGLSGLERRYPHQLSGGQQQRVALARALAIRPRVVLLDEPFSSLDAGLRASVRAEVGAVLREAGTTAVLVTHDQDEALSFADLVAVLREGRIVQVDTPARLYQQPLDVGVATFVGQANVLPAVMEGRMARCALGAVAVVEPPTSGTRVTLIVRPEQLRLDLIAGERPDPAAAATGVIVRKEYYGHDAVVTVALRDAGKAAGDSGQATIVARIAGEEPPPPGVEVSIRVAGPCQAWAAETTNGSEANNAESDS